MYSEQNKYFFYIKLAFLISFLVFTIPGVCNALGTTKTVAKDNLVAYWQFNESSGTTAKDVSGNNKNGHVYGTPTWSSGKIGGGFIFDGTNNYIQANPISSLTKSGTYTFSAWLKTSTIGTQTIFQSSPSCLDRNGAALNGNLLSFGYYNGSAWIGVTGEAPANKFFHVVGINNGGTLSLYINGVLQVGAGAPYVHCIDNNFYLGQETYPGNPTKFSGTMDDVRVYSRALSVSEVLKLYKTNAISIKNSDNTNLVGYWPLNGNYNDYSGKGNHFTVNGTCVSTSSDAVTGSISATGWGGCGTSPQLSGYFSLGDVLNSASEFTFTAWIKGSGNLWSGAATFWLVADATGAYLQKYTGSWVTIASGSGGGSYTSWRQLVVTKNSAGGVKIYSNGIEIASSTTQTFYTPTSHTIGRYAVYDDGGYHFSGKIDDVRMYGRVLSISEIKDLYRIKPAVANTSKTKVDNSLSVPILHYTFDGSKLNSSTSTDSGSTGAHGTLSGVFNAAVGRIGQALSFNGSTNYISVGSNMANNDMTIATWIKPRTTSGHIATEGVINSGIRFYLNFNANKINWACYNGGYYIAESNNAIQTDKWTHVVGAIKSGETGGLRLYINGVLQSSSSTIAACGSYGTLYIGSYIWPIGSYFNGVMDDFRIYNRSLSQAEITKLYQLGGK